MIESRLQTGHRRMMFSSQSSAQSTSSFSGGAETGIKRIVPHRGSVSDSDPPRSSPEAEPRLLKKIQLKEKYTFSPIASQRRFRRLAGYLRHHRQFDQSQGASVLALSLPAESNAPSGVHPGIWRCRFYRVRVSSQRRL